MSRHRLWTPENVFLTSYQRFFELVCDDITSQMNPTVSFCSRTTRELTTCLRAFGTNVPTIPSGQ